MRQHTAVLSLTVNASGAVTKHRAVAYDGEQVSATGATALGLARYDADAGKDLAVDVLGTSIAETGGAFNKGDPLVADGDGRLVVDPDAGGEYVMAYALEDSPGAGSFREVLLVQHQKPAGG